jgi:hypothetical protein
VAVVGWFGGACREPAGSLQVNGVVKLPTGTSAIPVLYSISLGYPADYRVAEAL